MLKEKANLLKGRPPNKWNKWLIPQFVQIPKGYRLTQEQ